MAVSGSRAFDGVDDEVFLTTIPGIDNNEMTAGAWVKFNSFSASATRAFLMTGSAKTAGNSAFSLEGGKTGDGQNLEVRYRWSSAIGLWRTSEALVANRWYYLSASYSRALAANNPIIYINGVIAGFSEATTPSGSAKTGVDTLVCGENVGGGGDHFGNIAHVQLWNRILSVGEIRQSMVTPGSISNGLRVYWPLFGTSNQEPDLSGHHNNANFNGTSRSSGPPIGRMFTRNRSRLPSIVPPSAGGAALTKDFTLTMSVAENETKDPLKHLIQAMSIQQNLTNQPQKSFSESITANIIITKEILKHIAQTLSFSESITNQVTKSFLQGLSLNENLTKEICKHLSQSITISPSETIIISSIVNIFLSQSITVTPNLTKGIAKHLTESLGISDALTKELLKHFTQSINIAQLKTLIYEKNLTQSLSVTEDELLNIVVISVSIAKLITFITNRGMIQDYDKKDMTNTLISTGISKGDLDDMKQDSDALNWDWHEGE